MPISSSPKRRGHPLRHLHPRRVGRPWTIKDYNCIFSDLDMENAHGLFREMYGSVGSFLYIVKTAINSEQRVADEMYARLHGSGSMVALQSEIMSILHPPAMRGYVFVESSALHHVEKLIGRSGGRDPSLAAASTSPRSRTPRACFPVKPRSRTSCLTWSPRPSPAASRSAASSKSSRAPSRAKGSHHQRVRIQGRGQHGTLRADHPDDAQHARRPRPCHRACRRVNLSTVPIPVMPFLTMTDGGEVSSPVMKGNMRLNLAPLRVDGVRTRR